MKARRLGPDIAENTVVNDGVIVGSVSLLGVFVDRTRIALGVDHLTVQRVPGGLRLAEVTKPNPPTIMRMTPTVERRRL
jgi:hypothetical protein